MSSKHLPLHTVSGSRIHEEICHADHTLRAAWNDRYRALQDKQFAQKVGAVEPKPKFEPKPTAPAFGTNGTMNIQATREQLDTMSTKQYDAYLVQTSSLWDLVNKGQLGSKPYNRRPMPGYYGRTLHSSSLECASLLRTALWARRL